jgi:transketolase
MRPALRLAAIQEIRSIFVYTHDSFYVGEDGPTHQPVEQIASMRAIPHVHVMRPCDANEVAQAWRYAIGRKNAPTVLCLTRQDLPTLDRTKFSPAEGTLKGGYVLSDEKGADLLMVATGSEVSLALSAATKLREQGRKVRIVSIPCLDLFQEQSKDYQDSVIPPSIKKRVVLEAGIEQGWGRILGQDGLFVGKCNFGTSAPYKVLAEKFGFTPDAVVEKIKKAGW